MRKILPLILTILIFGCSYGGNKTLKDYVENPGDLLRDPHFNSHVKDLDSLERQYLQKKITYAEYLDHKRQLEDDYSKEVQARRDVIENY